MFVCVILDDNGIRVRTDEAYHRIYVPNGVVRDDVWHSKGGFATADEARAYGRRWRREELASVGLI